MAIREPEAACSGSGGITLSSCVWFPLHVAGLQQLKKTVTLSLVSSSVLLKPGSFELFHTLNWLFPGSLSFGLALTAAFFPCTCFPPLLASYSLSSRILFLWENTFRVKENENVLLEYDPFEG